MTSGQNGPKLGVVPLLFLETCNFIWGLVGQPPGTSDILTPWVAC